MTSTAVTVSSAERAAASPASTERAGASPANGGPPANRPAIVRRSLVLAGILMAMLSMLLGGASSASAVTISAQSGYPGSATLVATYGASTGFASAKITVPWRNVTESTKYANYDQYVCVRPRLFESSGGRWIQSATASNCAWIPARSTSVNVAGADFTNVFGLNTFIYSVDVQVTWQLSNGAVIGSRTYDYNATGDYRCSTVHCKIANTTWGGGAFLEFDQ
jgi:hypothetical protein